jgi:hypothetical protein
MTQKKRLLRTEMTALRATHRLASETSHPALRATFPQGEKGRTLTAAVRPACGRS